MQINSSVRAARISRAELALLAAFIALIAAALLLPAIGQDPRYHRFADGRAWLGVPNAANVLSNLAFVAVGILGAHTLLSATRVRLSGATAIGLWCIAVGFVLTGIGSGWYHRQPDDATLAWDRLPMTLVIAGVVGAAIAQRVGERAAMLALVALIVAGADSVLYWRTSGNLTPYAVFQFGAIGTLLVLLLVTRAERDPFAWAWIVGWYCVAKAAELGDHAVWQWSGGIVSGHTIKHLSAAAAGAAMFYPLRER